MHVKRIYRPSVREALLAAREQLGPGALVLSTELVPALGWRGWLGQRIVRLTAAAERPSVDAGDAPPLSADRPSLAARRQAPIDQAREGAIARLVSIGMDRAFAQAVVGRLDAAECRGASEDALRRALATELESIAAGNTAVRPVRDLRRSARRGQDDHDREDRRSGARGGRPAVEPDRHRHAPRRCHRAAPRVRRRPPAAPSRRADARRAQRRPHRGAATDPDRHRGPAALGPQHQ